MNRAEHNAIQKAIATERAEILWKHYNATGKITTADVMSLTGRQAANLYKSFLTHGVNGPPVYDTHEQVRQRQIDALWNAAKELDKEWLSSQEAAAALGFQVKNIFKTEMRLKGKIPEIRYKRHLKGQRKKPELTHIPDEPYSLEYYRSEPGPGPNQITYFLK